MSERPPPQPTAEHLHRLKEGLFERWGQLPPEHQASLALVLCVQVMAGEYGPWLRKSIEVLEHKATHGPYKFLPILRLSPQHLAQTGLTADEIALLDEEDLRFISHEIVRHYTNDVFWEELEFLARKTLDEKSQD